MLPFFLKKSISRFLMPMPLIAICLIVGVLLFRKNRTRRAGRFVLILDIALFLLFGFGGLNPLLERLEKLYPQFNIDNAVYCESLAGADIVVLGQGLVDDASLHPRFRDNNCFRARMNEGALLCNRIPGSRMLVSLGGTESSDDDNALSIQTYAATYGIPTNRIVYFCHARDTAEEAARVKTMHRSGTLILVTSASHIPRAVKIFHNNGLVPIPAPCDYCYFGGGTKWRWDAIPFHWMNWERAYRLFHEYLGITYEALLGRHQST